MIRRRFISRLAAGGVASMGTLSASQSKAVTFHITGFTCITCAVGLDTMLLQHDGVLKSKSSYQDAKSTIEFNPDKTNEKALKSYISEMGFTAK